MSNLALCRFLLEEGCQLSEYLFPALYLLSLAEGFYTFII